MAVKQLPLNILTAPASSGASFASFEAGQDPLNRMALEAVSRAADAALQPPPSPPQPVPPLLLWGAPGSGKTHLLRAFAHALAAAGAACAYLSPTSDLPWELDPGWRAVLMDDCDGFDAARQQAAFGLFVQAQAEGLPVLAASHAPPVDLSLREDLRTRLAWGPVYALQPLAEPERRAVLRREADARGLFLADEVMDYMLVRFDRDLGSLMSLLNRLDQYALAEQRRLTVPLIRDMLKDTA